MKTLYSYLAALCLILACATTTQAQKISIRGGYNMSSIKEKVDNSSDGMFESKMRSGFHLGGLVDFSINKKLSFETGIGVTSKGTSFNMNELASLFAPGATMEMKVKTTYLEVPITLKYTQELNDNLDLFLQAGPYVGFGISGKTEISMELDGDTETEEDDIIWGNDEANDMLTHLDAGLTFGGGMSIGSVLVGVSYDLGLNNNMAGSSSDYGWSNRVWKLSVGYTFGK